MAKNKKVRPALKQTILLFNKPFQVLSQFTDEKGRATLSDFITDNQVYPAGRLDYDSEGLLVLTSDNILKQKITQPNLGFSKTYFVQVEGSPKEEQLEPLNLVTYWMKVTERIKTVKEPFPEENGTADIVTISTGKKEQEI